MNVITLHDQYRYEVDVYLDLVFSIKREGNLTLIKSAHGNSHGIERVRESLEEISALLPATFITLHGLNGAGAPVKINLGAVFSIKHDLNEGTLIKSTGEPSFGHGVERVRESLAEIREICAAVSDLAGALRRAPIEPTTPRPPQ